MADPFVVLTQVLIDSTLANDAKAAGLPEPRWPVGEQLQAQVRAILENGRTLLQIGQNLVDAKIPVRVAEGERLALRVVEPYPKLTFILEGVESSRPTQVSLSQAARVIGQLIQASSPEKASVLHVGAPTLPSPTDAVPKVAAEIAKTVRHAAEKSGLFYESHQARWVAGDYPLQELRQEPQARRRAQEPHPPASPPAPLESIATDELPESHTPPTREKEGRDLTSPSERQGTSLTTTQGQLQLIEGRPLTIAFPGWGQQEIHWQLPERESGADADAEDQIWNTQLHLCFPRLGALAARLSVRGNSIALSLETDNAAVSAELVREQASLINSVQAAGLALSQLSLTHRNG